MCCEAGSLCRFKMVEMNGLNVAGFPFGMVI